MFIARPGVRRFVVLALCVVMPVMTTLAAQTHVVPLAELHLWGLKTTISPEPFIDIQLEPGKEAKWVTEYTLWVSKG